MGVSKVDHEMIEMARAVLWKATRVHARLILPSDVVVTNKGRTAKPLTLPFHSVPKSLGIFDIGPAAREELDRFAKEAKTIIWNGPMGMYEDERFMAGTQSVFRSLATSRATTIIGGGDTISTIHDEALLQKVSHISTGGSAMLEFMEKGTLPAIEALKIMVSFLALVRHGESEWNARGLWTGLTDVHLTQKGRQEAKTAARLFAGYSL